MAQFNSVNIILFLIFSKKPSQVPNYFVFHFNLIKHVGGACGKHHAATKYRVEVLKLCSPKRAGIVIEGIVFFENRFLRKHDGLKR